LGCPITQLEALENGDLASLPDQALAISAMRRYANFLGLGGDELALRLIDAWSASPFASRAVGAPVPSVVAAVSAGPDHLRAFTQTGQVPKVGGRSTSAAAGPGASDYEVSSGPPTGTFPVVPRRELRHSRRAVARARRQLRAPTLLKILTWIAVVLVLVSLAGLGLRQWDQRWLADNHILRVVKPGTATPGTQPSVLSSGPNPSSASTHHSSVVAPGLVGPNGEAYTVHASHFTVNVATSGPCWLQITSSTSGIPLVSGVQPAGKLFSEPATGTMTVEVGSTAVLVGVAVKSKTVFLATPGVVPYTYTFAPAS
jgi:hypothetical protein